MPRFASIELQLYAAPNFVVMDVAQYENRFDDPAERRQCFSDSIRWRGAAQALEHCVGGHHAITEIAATLTNWSHCSGIKSRSTPE